jgi:hypothetical protein
MGGLTAELQWPGNGSRCWRPRRPANFEPKKSSGWLEIMSTQNFR